MTLVGECLLRGLSGSGGNAPEASKKRLDAAEPLLDGRGGSGMLAAARGEAATGPRE